MFLVSMHVFSMWVVTYVIIGMIILQMGGILWQVGLA
jgi:hypothetical protein